jgi:hypothetical protein
MSMVVNVVVNIRNKKRSYISVTPSLSMLPLLGFLLLRLGRIRRDKLLTQLF